MSPEEIAEALRERVQALPAYLGYKLNGNIYRLCWEDVVATLAEWLAGREMSPSDLNDSQLQALLDGGKKAAQTLPWSETIAIGLSEAGYDLFQDDDGFDEESEDDHHLEAMFEDRTAICDY